MFGTYDDWKLATPPEYEYMGTPPWEEEEEEEPEDPYELSSGHWPEDEPWYDEPEESL